MKKLLTTLSLIAVLIFALAPTAIAGCYGFGRGGHKDCTTTTTSTTSTTEATTTTTEPSTTTTEELTTTTAGQQTTTTEGITTTTEASSTTTLDQCSSLGEDECFETTTTTDPGSGDTTTSSTLPMTGAGTLGNGGLVFSAIAFLILGGMGLLEARKHNG